VFEVIQAFMNMFSKKFYVIITSFVHMIRAGLKGGSAAQPPRASNCERNN